MPTPSGSDGHPLRCALVGLGQIGTTHLEAMRVGGAELVAVADPREAARAVAKEKGLRAFAEARDPELTALVDAVVIATPPATHHELACHFLEHGVHVLCEKPLALCAREACGMLELARGRGLELMMASKFRYVGDVVEAHGLIESGVVGAPVVFENTFSGKVSMKERWNAKKAVSGGGVLIDNGTHSVDIARYLLGPLREVHALLGPSLQGLEVEDTARLSFRTDGGAFGSADLSWSLQKENESYVAIYGQTGTLVLGWKGSRYRREGSSGWVAFGEGYDKLRCLRAQFANFVEVIRGRERPRITSADALASVEVIEAAYASAAESRWRPVGARS
jgi:predicted dehydrogenase